MKKILFILLCTIMLVHLSACNTKNVHQKITEHIERTVKIEEDFEVVQEELFTLEKRDQEIFNEMVAIDSNNKKELTQLSNQAIELLDKRMEHIKLEKSSIDNSKREFEKIKPLLKDISNGQDRSHVKRMYDAMMNRYNAYDLAYEKYVESLMYTKNLYELFQKEVNEHEIYAAITNVNESYHTVFEANETFNKETVLYNNLKKEYYELLSEK